jgi:hypothetical protein
MGANKRYSLQTQFEEVARVHVVDDATIVIYFLLSTLIIFTCFLALIVNVLSLVVGTR